MRTRSLEEAHKHKGVKYDNKTTKGPTTTIVIRTMTYALELRWYESVRRL